MASGGDGPHRAGFLKFESRALPAAGITLHQACIQLITADFSVFEGL